MTNEKIQETIDSLDEMLEEERKALVSGGLDKIVQLHEKKTQLVEQLRVLDLQDQDQLKAIRDKIDRNQSLLNSAIDGIRSVAARLAAVRHVRESLDTYDSEGRRKTIKTLVDKSLEKRA